MTAASAPDLSRLSTPYFVLHIAGGHVGIPTLILLFIVARRVHRPASVINFCLTWVIFSVSYCLLMYAGHHGNEYPPFKLCLVQAAMIHGAPPMVATAGLGVVLQAYSTFQLPWQYRWTIGLSKVPGWLLVVFIVTPPYLVFIAFAVTTAVAGLRHRDTVKSETRLYCSIAIGAGPFEDLGVPIFCTILLVAIVALEVAMIIQYWYSWLRIKHAFPLAIRKPSLSPWLRVSAFTLYSLATLLICVAFVTRYFGPLSYMIPAALPMVATIIFGSQNDVYRAVTAWACKPPRGDDARYTPGGGWSATESSRLSAQLTGHLTLTSEA